MDLIAESNKVFSDEPERKDYRVGVILMAPSGRCLALLRSANKSLGGNTWGAPGGKVKAGETLAEAAVREAKEETGKSPSSIFLIHAEQAAGIKFRTFVGFVPEEFIPALNSEHTDHKWVYPQEWPHPIFQGMQAVLLDAQALQALQQPSHYPPHPS